ncbi:hypothetical protein [Stenotrophomonas sp. Ker107b]
MKESIFNIYLYFDPSDRCERVGYAVHELVGDDAQGLQLLQKNLKADLQRATKVKLQQSFTRQQYNARARLGSDRALLDDLFVHAGADHGALAVITPVLGGKVMFNYSSQVGEFDIGEAAAAAGEQGEMVDWLSRYTDDEGFHFSQLIHDDYFASIKLTFNAGLYVSSMKLLLSCIDSLAYLDYGDVRDPPSFVRWLRDYADLSALGITAEELWELRNGLLHMTNINSSRVKNNAVRRISFRVGNSEHAVPQSGSVFFFDFKGLIDVFSRAQARWIASCGPGSTKFETFVERYDDTVSDVRLAIIQLDR